MFPIEEKKWTVKGLKRYLTSKIHESREEIRLNIQRGKFVDRLHQRMRSSSLMQTLAKHHLVYTCLSEKSFAPKQPSSVGAVYKRRSEESAVPYPERSRIYYQATVYRVYSRCIDNRIPFIALRCLGASIDRRIREA